MYAYTIQNNVFRIVQGLAIGMFAPFQGHVYGSFKGIMVTYLPITFIL